MTREELKEFVDWPDCWLEIFEKNMKKGFEIVGSLIVLYDKRTTKFLVHRRGRLITEAELLDLVHDFCAQEIENHHNGDGEQ